jgi:hypothetical protein
MRAVQATDRQQVTSPPDFAFCPVVLERSGASPQDRHFRKRADDPVGVDVAPRTGMPCR